MSRKKDAAAYVFIAAAAVVFLMIFSRGTSPLYPGIYTNDSTIFMYIGRAMKYGYIPYRDMYDIKGPVMWFIQYLGQVIHEGKSGIFMIEMLAYIAVLILTYRIARQSLKILQSLIVVLVSMIFLAGSYDDGNSVEQYSYLCSMISLYITVKAVDKGFTKWHFVVYCITGMCAMLMRFTDCCIVGACVVYAFWELAKEKRINTLIAGVMLALSAAVIVLLLFVIYYASHEALYDMIDATIIFSRKYAEFNKTYSIKWLLIFVFPLVVSVIGIVKDNNPLARLLLVMTVMAAVVYAITGTTYAHYMITAIPCVTLALLIAIKKMSGINPIIIALAAILFCGVNGIYMHRAVNLLMRVADIGSANMSTGFADDISSIIDDRDSVYSYYSDIAIQFRNNTHSRSRYFTSQIPWSRDAETKDIIFEDFVNGNDRWVITDEFNMENGDKRIADILSSGYTLAYSRDGYLLYKREEQ